MARRRVNGSLLHTAARRGSSAGVRVTGSGNGFTGNRYIILLLLYAPGGCASVCGCAGGWVRVRRARVWVVRDCVFRFDESYVWDDSSAGTHSTLYNIIIYPSPGAGNVGTRTAGRRD